MPSPTSRTQFKKGVFSYRAGGGITFHGDVRVNGDFESDAMTFTEPFTFEDELTLEDGADVTGNVAVVGDLDVTGTFTLVGDVAQTGSIVASASVTAADLVSTDDVTVGDDLVVTGLATIGETLVVTAAATFTLGQQSAAVARTAPADGTGTGAIAPGTRFVAITSGNSAHIITLPAAVVGNVIEMWVGANGCELRTPAASGATINGVNSDGTNQAALPATTLVRAICVAANTWIVDIMDEAGDDIAALVPDAP